MSVVQNERAAESRFETNRLSREATEERTSERIVAGAFSLDAVAAAATVVLAILGLAGIYPAYMVPIAVITTASAMLVKSGGVASRFNKLARETGRGAGPRTELATGMSAEMLGGAAGIALGVLALIGLVPATLVAVSVIVFGGALLLGGGETFRISHLGLAGSREDTAEYIARMSAESAAGGESLVGIGAVVLGILALVGIQGIQPSILVLVALLSLGGAMLLSGATIRARMLAALR